MGTRLLRQREGDKFYFATITAINIVHASYQSRGPPGGAKRTLEIKPLHLLPLSMPAHPITIATLAIYYVLTCPHPFKQSLGVSQNTKGFVLGFILLPGHCLPHPVLFSQLPAIIQNPYSWRLPYPPARVTAIRDTSGHCNMGGHWSPWPCCVRGTCLLTR